MEFIISIHVGFSEVLTGGILVMHKLAYEIASRGYKVTIFTEPEYPHPNISVQKNCSEDSLNFDYDPNTTVIIPSFYWKNNGNIKNVARWALYHINGDTTSFIDDTDEIFNFGIFKIETTKEVKKLTTIDYQKQIFYDRGNKRNGKYCHYLLKNNPVECREIISYFNSFDLNDYKSRGCFEYLADVFNEYEYFLTFDDKTFLTIAAAMCGCKPIILKNNNINPVEFRLENPNQSVGIAYGIDDLKWSENTIGFIRKHVDYLEQCDNQTIDNFIDFWKTKIGM
jgi:hypothetical protein